ncbi:MAG: transcription termination/antitermination factor NusG [Kiritimatiellae bacterium]|nr:transcription termination/antitermination factor NusG [Kiritimatiellia bacterium]
MSKQWFVLNTLTGQEQKVQKLLVAKAQEAEIDMAGMIGETLMPTVKEVSTRNGRKTTVMRKLFPGYVFAELDLYSNYRKRERNEAVWSFVNGLDGVIGFLGGDHPRPMTEDEIANVKAAAGDENAKPKAKISFEPGEPVKIVDGAFMSSEGTVQSVDPDRGRLVVSVSIFGGDTPVELEYAQVERLEKTDEKKAAAAEQA